MTEQYKLIKEHENYSISTFGNVKNNTTGKILKPYKCYGYLVVGLMNNQIRKQFNVHRLVATAFIDSIEHKPNVDHINNDKLNNNLSNLRWVSQRENCQNTRLSTCNTSGIKGVSLNKQTNKWMACITVSGIPIKLGSFINKEDAIACRIKRANEAFGVFTNACEKLDV